MSASAAQQAAVQDVLRVLAGTNVGAEVSLGEGSWLIGSADDADLTFLEPALAPRHMRLLSGPGSLALEALAEGVRVGGSLVPPGEQRPLKALDVVTVGDTAFTLGPPGSRWPSPNVMQEAAAAVPEATEPDPVVAEGAAAARGEAGDTVPTPPPGGATGPERLSPPLQVRRARWPWAVLAVLLVLGGVAGLLLWPAAPAPSPSRPPADALAAARTVVHEMGLDGWVDVSGKGPRPTVSGEVRSAEQARQLQAGLRRAGVDAEVALMPDGVVVDMVRTVLSSFAIDAVVAVTAPGEVTLTGFSPDSTRLSLAERRIRGDVMVVRKVVDHMDTPDRARDGLDAAVRAAGLGSQLRLGVTPKGVTATGALGPEGMATWTRLATAFRAEHDDRMPLIASVASLASAEPRGVVLGRNPALVMPDGRRLGIGDTLGTLGRIVAIDATRVRVRAASGEVELPYSRKPGWIMEDKP